MKKLHSENIVVPRELETSAYVTEGGYIVIEQEDDGSGNGSSSIWLTHHGAELLGVRLLELAKDGLPPQ